MYEGDVDRLAPIFHDECWLHDERSGDKRGFPVSVFFAYVSGAPVPKDAGEPFAMRIVLIDRTGPVAVVKV